MTTTIINLEIKVQIQIKGSNGKRRRRTEDPEDWSRTRGQQQWTTEVSLDFFVQSVLILSSGSTEWTTGVSFNLFCCPVGSDFEFFF